MRRLLRLALLASIPVVGLVHGTAVTSTAVARALLPLGAAVIGAGLESPVALALAPNGEMLVADTGAHQVLRYSPHGQVSVVGKFYTPVSVAIDRNGAAYVAEVYWSLNGVYKVTPKGVQSKVGSGLDHPYGVVLNGHGDLFISDSSHNRVVRVAASGTQTTVVTGLLASQGSCRRYRRRPLRRRFRQRSRGEAHYQAGS